MYDVVIVAVDHGIPQGNVKYFSLYKLHDLCTIQFCYSTCWYILSHNLTQHSHSLFTDYWCILPI